MRTNSRSDFKRCSLNHFKYSFPSVFIILWFWSYLLVGKMFVWSCFFAILIFHVKVISTELPNAIYHVDFIMYNLSNTLYLLWNLHHLKATIFQFTLNNPKYWNFLPEKSLTNLQRIAKSSNVALHSFERYCLSVFQRV